MIQKKHIKQVKDLFNGTLGLGCLFLLSSIITAEAVVWNENVSEEEVLEMARPMSSVVQIEIMNVTGSGVLITDRHVLTAKHVVMASFFQAYNYDQMFAPIRVTIENASGNKTSIMAKGVYLHPSDADIAIIELPHSVAQLLNDDEGNSTIIPSPLYREDPQDLCEALLHGAGYGNHAMATDEHLQESDGSRRYYETFFSFVLDTYCPCFAHSGYLDYLSQLTNVIIIAESEDFGNTLDKESLMLLEHTLRDAKDRLRDLTNNISFEIGANNERTGTPAKFMGNTREGDSGSPLFNEEGQVIAVITKMIDISGNSSLASHSSTGVLVYPFLDWIDDVAAGREVEMHSVNSYIFALESLMYYILYSVSTGELPESYLYGVLPLELYGVIALEHPGLIYKALYYSSIFSSLDKGSYLKAFLLIQLIQGPRLLLSYI